MLDSLEVLGTRLASSLEEREDFRPRSRVRRSSSLDEKKDVIEQLPDIGTRLVDRDDDCAPRSCDVFESLHDVVRCECIETCRVAVSRIYERREEGAYQRAAHRQRGRQGPR